MRKTFAGAPGIDSDKLDERLVAVNEVGSFDEALLFLEGGSRLVPFKHDEGGLGDLKRGQRIRCAGTRARLRM